MQQLSIKLFGPFQAGLDGQEINEFKSQKVRALLAYLAVESERPHTRDSLAAMLWPDWPDRAARDNLRYALYNLRQVIRDGQAEPPFLLISQDMIRFNPASQVSLDVQEFTRRLETWRSQPSAPELLKEAVQCYQGEFLEGFAPPDSLAFDEWMTLKREELHRQLVEALEALADYYENSGDYRQALAYALRETEIEPWQENGHRQVMRLLAYSGQRSAALIHFERYRQQLSKELGVLPDERTQSLFDQLQDGKHELVPPGKHAGRRDRVKAIGACPYRGLSAFREQDAPFYFGRDGYIQQLLEALERQPMVVVLIGASGSGKSSVVYAGVLPRIRTEKGWLVADFRPGQRPFHALAAALTPRLEPGLTEAERLVEAQKLEEALLQGQVLLQDVLERILQKNSQMERFLLVTDQFEEIYTLCSDEKMQQRFLDMLLETAQGASVGHNAPVKIMLTLRADFMGRALSYRPFADALQDSTQMLGPMSPAELRVAIEKPAEKQGASFEQGLVDRILEEVGEKPGNLPLLEFALTLLWDEAIDGLLTHAAYEKIGRVPGALTRYAEQVYTGLEQKEQAAARKILMQLIQPGVGTEDTRRVANRDEIGEESWSLVQYLADKRLVVTSLGEAGAGTVEVIHEALIQEWPRLKGWMDADRAFRTWQETLRVSIRQWEAAHRDDSALLRGVLLVQAENWLAERMDELSELEKGYIQASMAQRQRMEDERRRSQQLELEKAMALAFRERRNRRILGAFTGILALLVLAALGLTLFANQQRRQALTAYSLSLAANAEQALADLDTGTALILALAANRVQDPPKQAQRILLAAAYAPGARSRDTLAALFPGVVGPATSLAFSPDGTRVLVGTAGGKLVLWEPASGSHQILNGHNGRVNAVAIAPDGATALSAGWDYQVIYWDLHTGAMIRRMGDGQGGHSGVVRAVAFSPDGRRAVSGGLAGDSILNPGELILWDLESGREIRRFNGHTNGVVAAAFTPDGKEILASSGDSEIVIEGEKVQGSNATYDVLLWDSESGELKAKYQDVGHDVFTLAISPDGKRALLGSYYNPVITLLELGSGKVLSTLTGHANAVRVVAFLPGGQQALSAGEDSTLILWNLATGKPLVVYRAGESSQLALAIQPDGRSAVSSTRDSEIFRWDLQDAAVIRRLVGHDDAIFDVDYTPDGQRALSCSGGAQVGMPARDASLRLWDLQTGRQLLRMTPPVQVIFQCAISPDGRQALSGSEDGLVRLWDLESGAEIRQFKGHNDWVISMAFTPDGKQALTGSKDGSLILWDLKEGRVVRKMFSAPSDNWSVAISPDGKRALTDAALGGAIYWDLESGTEIRRLRRNDISEKPGVSGVAFLPDGKTAITGEDDGYVIQWDLATGKEIRRFGRHNGIRTRVEISRDGKTLLTSGTDGVLRLWDLGSGELVREFGYAAPAVVFDIRISPDGQTALSGSIDQMVTQWSLSNPSLKELTDWIAANRYLRELTCAERVKYQIEPLCVEE